MNYFVRLALAVGFMLLVPLTHAAPLPHPGVSVVIEHNDTVNTSEGAVWLAYLTARSTYVREHQAEYAWKPGVVTPSFPEELTARTKALQVYRELKHKDAQLSLAYFEDLALVADSSFLGEYVWTYLHQAGWGTPPQELHLVEFMRWRAQHLAQHTVITHGNLRFEAKGQAAAAAPEQAQSEVSTLAEGRKAVEHGEAALAIAGYFDPVIEHFSRSHRDASKRLYAARNQRQVLMYLARAAAEKQSAEVLDSTWADAYLMKAYALTELKQLQEAQAALEKAIELSPLTAQYISELAYTYQAQGQCDRSIATYKEAESAAEQGSDNTTKTADLTRAWRGQGYCLVELGRFDEAEALYRKCLTLDPSDTKAQGELEYIRKKRTP